MSNVESARGNRWQLYRYKATPDDFVAISPLTGTCQELKVKRERAAAYKHGISCVYVGAFIGVRALSGLTRYSGTPSDCKPRETQIYTELLGKCKCSGSPDSPTFSTWHGDTVTTWNSVSNLTYLHYCPWRKLVVPSFANISNQLSETLGPSTAIDAISTRKHQAGRGSRGAFGGRKFELRLGTSKSATTVRRPLRLPTQIHDETMFAC
ncbi:uncharacterized protein B0T23DRAFT_440545 [Neurospora hispaniola]|uniref:Uncharacterized protein n=1 Tax=Neurospora hispaniola TaxID=588809 RepID=A0AAJ0IAG1_9PEZI|nr:hypothetical protein B0T23DRAFT_440545 [Neurospora hispaniola]